MAHNSEFNTILISPPPENTMTIQIEGVFHSDTLIEDLDENFWSVNHPLTLIHAALMKLEEVYRNTEGVKDWSAAIDKVITPLNMDGVEEEIVGINEMQG